MAKFGFSVLLAILLAFGGFAAPIRASASYPSVTRGSTAYLDWCPGNAALCQDSKAISHLPAGTYLKMVCWIDARSTGYNTARWFYSNISNGKTGFLNASGVGSQEVVGACSAKPSVMATLWTTGTSHYAAIYPTSTDKSLMKQYFGFTNWGTYGDWSGDCISFAALSWLSTSTTRKIYFANAYQSFLKYKSAGKVHSSGIPPIGALVYWNAYYGSTNYGHVAVSLGNNWTLGTQGWDNQKLPTVAKAISTTNYLGWVMPF